MITILKKKDVLSLYTWIAAHTRGLFGNVSGVSIVGLRKQILSCSMMFLFLTSDDQLQLSNER